MSLLVNQPFNFSVSLRVAWSMFWRMVLIGAVFSLALKFVLPASVIELQMDGLASREPAPSYEEIRAYVATIDYSGMGYFYHLFKSYLPIVLAVFVAASFVFKKRYRRFSLSVTDLQGAAISTRWWPALCIGTVFLLPTVVASLAGHIINRLIPTLSLSPAYIVVAVALGTLLLLYNAHLAVHWKYRAFRVQVGPAA